MTTNNDVVLSATAKVQLAKKKLDEARQTMVENIGAAITEGASDIFAKYPTLIAFKWRQYTPYFNDGDTCTFSAHIDYPSILVKDGTGIAEGEDNPGWFGENEDNYFNNGKTYNQAKRCYELTSTPDPEALMMQDVVDFLRSLGEESLENLGDHLEITINRTSGMSTSDIDHD